MGTAESAREVHDALRRTSDFTRAVHELTDLDGPAAKSSGAARRTKREGDAAFVNGAHEDAVRLYTEAKEHPRSIRTRHHPHTIFFLISPAFVPHHQRPHRTVQSTCMPRLRRLKSSDHAKEWTTPRRGSQARSRRKLRRYVVGGDDAVAKQDVASRQTTTTSNPRFFFVFATFFILLSLNFSAPR